MLSILSVMGAFQKGGTEKACKLQINLNIDLTRSFIAKAMD